MTETYKKSSILIETFLTTLILVVVTRILYAMQGVPFIGEYYTLIFAILFLYVPIVILRARRRPIDFFDRGVKQYLHSFIVFVVVSLIVFPIFLLAAHGWQTIVWSFSGPTFGPIPEFWKYAAYQLIIVALPEEVFFRGYVQSSLNLIFPRKWRLFGVDFGWGLFVTALVFAFAHSIISLQWWHFAIFFPALLFGYIREKTGTVTAPILLHALSNIIMYILTYTYR